MNTAVKYQHVDGHMDKYLPRHQLSLEQKMNVMYDALTKRTVVRAIRTGTRREGKQLLPSEDAAISVKK